MLKTYIYIVNGAAGSGKTTFENAACDEFIIDDNHRAIKLSTIDFVKHLAMECGWDGTKTPANRKFLSDLKMLLANWGDVPCKFITSSIDKMKNTKWATEGDDKYLLLFIDCREPAEIAKLYFRLDCKTIYISNNKAEEEVASNNSDANVKGYKYNIYLNNNGTLDEWEAIGAEFGKNLLE